MGEFSKPLMDRGKGGAISVTSPESLSDIFDFLIVGTGFAGAAWPAANRAFFVPFATARYITVKQMAWQNGSTVSGNLDVGIYDIDGNQLVHSGSVAQSGISAAQIADITDTALDPGQYFMAMAVDNTTGLYFRVSNADAQLLQVFGMQQMDTAFPLPSTATFANPATAYLPQLVMLLNATA